MGKKKLIRFKANATFPRLFEPPALELLVKDHHLKGKWAQDFFGNDNRLTLELGCGRGEYTIGMARLFPAQNFIGVDIKGSRLFFGVTAVQNEKISNACFVRSQIELINKIFAREVSEIWVTFPDPYPHRAHRRLTSPAFLNRYVNVLNATGTICLKTDDHNLYSFTRTIAVENGLEIIDDTDDLYNSPLQLAMPQIQTAYEKRFLDEGKKICFLRFRLDREVMPLPKKRQAPAKE
ncbi:MAG: tRNA (guanosine(46)-N7)-methyltransferase TrmB [Candidatus Riflebacteria bacterium]|jgi:tRNA (guanine-N7-)-methyltransferase|nr:tRNA (guanosine(46)-N7)-methyltransferase TrmB [Candidatus Riflebacteria bacterium]